MADGHELIEIGSEHCLQNPVLVTLSSTDEDDCIISPGPISVGTPPCETGSEDSSFPEQLLLTLDEIKKRISSSQSPSSDLDQMLQNAWADCLTQFFEDVTSIGNRMGEGQGSIDLHQLRRELAANQEYLCRVVSISCDGENEPEIDCIEFVSDWAQKIRKVAQDVYIWVSKDNMDLVPHANATLTWMRLHISYILQLLQYILESMEESSEDDQNPAGELSVTAYLGVISSKWAFALSILAGKATAAIQQLQDLPESSPLEMAISALSEAFWFYSLTQQLRKQLVVIEKSALSSDLAQFSHFRACGGVISDDIFKIVEFLPSRALKTLFDDSASSYTQDFHFFRPLSEAISSCCQNLAPFAEPPSYSGSSGLSAPVVLPGTDDRPFHPFQCRLTAAWCEHAKKIRLALLEARQRNTGSSTVCLTARDMKLLFAVCSKMQAVCRAFFAGSRDSHGSEEIMGVPAATMAEIKAKSSDEAQRAASFCALDLANLSNEVCSLLLVNVWSHRANLAFIGAEEALHDLGAPLKSPPVWNAVRLALSFLLCEDARRTVIQALSATDPRTGTFVASNLLKDVSLQSTVSLIGITSVIKAMSEDLRFTVHSPESVAAFVEKWMGRARKIQLFSMKLQPLVSRAEIRNNLELQFFLALLSKISIFRFECSAASSSVATRHVTNFIDLGDSTPLSELINYACDVNLLIFSYGLLHKLAADMTPVIHSLLELLTSSLQRTPYHWKNHDVDTLRELLAKLREDGSSEPVGLNRNETRPGPRVFPQWKGLIPVFSSYVVEKMASTVASVSPMAAASFDVANATEALVTWLTETASVHEYVEMSKRDLAELQKDHSQMPAEKLFQRYIDLLVLMTDVKMALAGKKIFRADGQSTFGCFGKIRILASSLHHYALVEFCSGEIDIFVDKALEGLDDLCSSSLIDSVSDPDLSAARGAIAGGFAAVRTNINSNKKGKRRNVKCPSITARLEMLDLLQLRLKMESELRKNAKRTESNNRSETPASVDFDHSPAQAGSSTETASASISPETRGGMDSPASGSAPRSNGLSSVENSPGRLPPQVTSAKMPARFSGYVAALSRGTSTAPSAGALAKGPRLLSGPGATTCAPFLSGTNHTTFPSFPSGQGATTHTLPPSRPGLPPACRPPNLSSEQTVPLGVPRGPFPMLPSACQQPFRFPPPPLHRVFPDLAVPPPLIGPPVVSVQPVPTLPTPENLMEDEANDNNPVDDTLPGPSGPDFTMSAAEAAAARVYTLPMPKSKNRRCFVRRQNRIMARFAERFGIRVSSPSPPRHVASQDRGRPRQQQARAQRSRSPQKSRYQTRSPVRRGSRSRSPRRYRSRSPRPPSASGYRRHSFNRQDGRRAPKPRGTDSKQSQSPSRRRRKTPAASDRKRRRSRSASRNRELSTRQGRSSRDSKRRHSRSTSRGSRHDYDQKMKKNANRPNVSRNVPSENLDLASIHDVHIRSSVTPESDFDENMDMSSLELKGDVLKLRLDRDELREKARNEQELSLEVRKISTEYGGCSILEFCGRVGCAGRTIGRKENLKQKRLSLAPVLAELKTATSNRIRPTSTSIPAIHDLSVEKSTLDRSQAVFKALTSGSVQLGDFPIPDLQLVATELRRVNQKLRSKLTLRSLPERDSLELQLYSSIRGVIDSLSDPDSGTFPEILSPDNLKDSLQKIVDRAETWKSSSSATSANT